MKKRFVENEVLQAYIQIVLGCAVGAAAYPLFLTPNHIGPGGLTGIATVLNYLFPVLPIGITSLALNVPLFLMGYRSMGRVFAFRSLVATILFSLLIDLLPLKPLTYDILLGSLFGGILLGTGLGLILRGGATTGGTDMAARMLHERFPHISTGMILFTADCVSVIFAAVSIEIQYALYAFISIYASSKVVDMVMLGRAHNVACYVISGRYEQIKQGIFEELSRGVTLLSSEGGYTGKSSKVLLCIVSAQEVGRFKAIVRNTDEKAFVFTTGASEVLGEGFRRLTEDKTQEKQG